MAFFGLFGAPSPTVNNDLAAATANVKSIVGDTDILEVIVANGIKSGIPSVTTSIKDEAVNTYLGAGEVAYGMPGTEQVHIIQAIAGADTVLSSAGNVTPNLIPHWVKCALVCLGMGAKSIGDTSQITEALTLAVAAAPTA